MTSNIKLPKNPTVIAQDETVIVRFANGSELVWGQEASKEKAIQVAKELEIELKAVKYVQWHVKNFIQDMKEYLTSLDIDENLLVSILIDGHAQAREELKQLAVDSIIMGAEQGLRRQVLTKLHSDDYIV